MDVAFFNQPGGPQMSNRHRGRRYGFFSFIFDVFMTCITGGLWLIWVFVREMRKR